MFWRFGFQSSSTLETLLQRENPPPTVDELLDEVDLLSELKGGNTKLIQILSQVSSIRCLLSWVTYPSSALVTSSSTLKTRADAIVDRWMALPGAKSGGLRWMRDLKLEEGEQIIDEPESDGLGSPSAGNGGPLDEDETKRLRYAQIATEILCSDLWSITEVAFQNLDTLMRPFCDTVLPVPLITDLATLSNPSQDDLMRSSLRVHALELLSTPNHLLLLKNYQSLLSYFTRISALFLTRRPADYLNFVRSLPFAIPRMLSQIDSPAIQDLLLRIVSFEEGGVQGIIEWLSNEGLVKRLLLRLSPWEDASSHGTVSELVKSIIALSAPSPFNPSGGNGMEQQQVLTSPSPEAAAGNSNSPPPDGQLQQSQTPQQIQNAPPPGQRDNRLVRELVGEDSVALLLGFIFDHIDFVDGEDDGDATPGEGGAGKPGSLVEVRLDGQAEVKDAPQVEEENGTPQTPTEVKWTYDPYITTPLPNIESGTSSLCNCLIILIELIRKNNSDFSEPLLFHSIRNRLMKVQQKQVDERAATLRLLESERDREDEEKQMLEHVEEKDGGKGKRKEQTPEEAKEAADKLDEAESNEMEAVMAELSGKLGIVHLGPLLHSVGERIEDLQALIRAPRSLKRSRTPNIPHPLTIERLRIVELYAELLHCSNMSILNRLPGTGPKYSKDGCLVGGLEALKELGRALEGDNGAEGERPPEDELEQVKEARELPVSAGSTDCSLTNSSDLGSDAGAGPELSEDLSPDDEDIPTANLNVLLSSDASPTPPPPSQADVARLRDVMAQEPRPHLRAMDAGNMSDMASVSHMANAPASETDVELKDDTPAAVEGQDDDSQLTLGDRFKKTFIAHRVLQQSVDLFFEYPLNNFLHNVVFDLFQQILNGRLGPGLNREFIILLFREAKVIEKILDAQRLNDRLSIQKKATRLSNMGHLTLTAEEFIKFFERAPKDLLAELEESYLRSEWDAYVEGPLKDTKLRDTQPLGGGRPAPNIAGNPPESDSDDEEGATPDNITGPPLTRSPANGFSPSFGYGDAEMEREPAASGSTQFARYLMNETYPGQAVSSDDDSDDSSNSPRIRPANGRTHSSSSDGFDDSFGSARNVDMDDDDAWGNFASADAGPPGEDPFGDPFGDQFEPSPRGSSAAPLTSAGFAAQAFSSWQDDEMDDTRAIHVPPQGDDSFEDASMFLASSWSIPGGEVDAGEDLPPTISPLASPVQPEFEEPAVPIRLTVDTLPKSPVRRRRSRTSSMSSNHSNHSASGILRNEKLSPSLLEATSPIEPLGHGVSPDVVVREDGKLEREIDGRIVTAPQDEIAEIAIETRRTSLDLAPPSS